MRRLPSACRWAATVLVLSSLLTLLGAPVCESDSCPMSASQRAACKAMGRECCQGKGGAVSHASPRAPAPAAALAGGGLPMLAVQDQGAAGSVSSLPDAAPAVLQGVGLFTLLAVFRI
ncbi:MAG TPA: hypothetical protein VE075_05725 [Thermoanaerobaculia bacterium]|nr:hypothetical protein [Thermoanaerobaculia bacterium]